MTQQAIAEAVGVNQATVQRTLATYANAYVDQPTPVMGKDGKVRPAQIHKLHTQKKACAGHNLDFLNILRACGGCARDGHRSRPDEEHPTRACASLAGSGMLPIGNVGKVCPRARGCEMELRNERLHADGVPPRARV